MNSTTYASRFFGGKRIHALLGVFHLISKKHGGAEQVGTIDTRFDLSKGFVLTPLNRPVAAGEEPGK